MCAGTLSPLRQLLAVINDQAGQSDISFDTKTIVIKEFVNRLKDEDLKHLLGEAGFIPEQYGIDSSEEKVYAKAMDILVAESLSRVGYQCEVSEERSNSADVSATCASGKCHEMVLDAKAFRLSRTALNPKDYKIEALSTWRKKADFSALVAPLAGFPQGRSRIYREAINFNVTLLTFSHLQFILEKGIPEKDSLLRLWGISTELKKSLPPNPSAQEYWARLDKVFCELLNVDLPQWKSARKNYFSAMLAVADEQVRYFEEKKKEVGGLSREQLIPLATKALRFNERIRVIKKKKERAVALLTSIEQAEK